MVEEDLRPDISEDQVDSVAEEDEFERDQEVLVVEEAHRFGTEDEEPPGEELEG